MNRRYEHAKHCATMCAICIMMVFLVWARFRRAMVIPRSFVYIWTVLFLGMCVAINPLDKHPLVWVSVIGGSAGAALVLLSIRDAAQIYREMEA